MATISVMLDGTSIEALTACFLHEKVLGAFGFWSVEMLQSVGSPKHRSSEMSDPRLVPIEAQEFDIQDDIAKQHPDLNREDFDVK